MQRVADPDPALTAVPVPTTAPPVIDASAPMQGIGPGGLTLSNIRRGGRFASKLASWAAAGTVEPNRRINDRTGILNLDMIGTSAFQEKSGATLSRVVV